MSYPSFLIDMELRLSDGTSGSFPLHETETVLFYYSYRKKGTGSSTSDPTDCNSILKSIDKVTSFNGVRNK